MNGKQIDEIKEALELLLSDWDGQLVDEASGDWDYQIDIIDEGLAEARIVIPGSEPATAHLSFGLDGTRPVVIPYEDAAGDRLTGEYLWRAIAFDFNDEIDDLKRKVEYLDTDRGRLEKQVEGYKLRLDQLTDVVNNLPGIGQINPPRELLQKTANNFLINENPYLEEPEIYEGLTTIEDWVFSLEIIPGQTNLPRLFLIDPDRAKIVHQELLSSWAELNPENQISEYRHWVDEDALARFAERIREVVRMLKETPLGECPNAALYQATIIQLEDIADECTKLERDRFLYDFSKIFASLTGLMGEILSAEIVHSEASRRTPRAIFIQNMLDSRQGLNLNYDSAIESYIPEEDDEE